MYWPIFPCHPLSLSSSLTVLGVVIGMESELVFNSGFEWSLIDYNNEVVTHASVGTMTESSTSASSLTSKHNVRS